MPRLKLWAWQSSRVRQAVSSAAFVLSALTLLRTWCAVLLLVTYGFLLSYSDAAANPRAAVRYVETKMNWKFMLLFESIDIKFYGSNLSIYLHSFALWSQHKVRCATNSNGDTRKEWSYQTDSSLGVWPSCYSFIGGQWRTIGTIFILVALFSRKVFRGSDTDVETIPLYTVHFIARYTRSTSNGTLPT